MPSETGNARNGSAAGFSPAGAPPNPARKSGAAVASLTTVLNALLALAVLLAVMGLFVAFETVRAGRAADDVAEAASGIARQLEVFANVEKAIGYTHFIHNFKNGVLRLDPDLLTVAERDLAQARRGLDELRRLNPALAPPALTMDRTLDE